MTHQPSQAYQVMLDFQRRLTRREADASLEMAKRWKGIEDRLTGYFDALLNQVQVEGIKTKSEVFRLYRYEQLLKTAQDEIRQFERDAGQVIRTEQHSAIDMGLEAAVKSIYGDQYLAPSVNRGALASMVGLCADGQPLFSLLAGRALSDVSIQGLTDKLIEGLALGYNPRKTARMMADGLAAGLEKALTIARTEQIRAYREGTRTQYEAMGIKRYRRHCAKTDRTCLACLALDGKIYAVNRVMDSHPNCRCFMVAVVQGMEEDRASAQEWFGGLDEARQREILGKGRFELYQQGVPLEKMVRVRHDPVWGPTVGVEGVKEIKKNAQFKETKIDFRSDVSQYIARLGDIRKFYSPDDPGIRYLTPKPVYYNFYSASHLMDEEHIYRMKWLEDNMDELIKAVENPNYIEFFLRKLNNGHFSSTQIVELGNKKYMTVAISLSLDNEGEGYHQITTIHPSKWRDLFFKDGTLKPKYKAVE